MGNKKRIVLLVEDDPFLQKLFRSELGDLADLYIAETEPDALNKFEELKDKIFILIADGNLKNGGDTFKLMQNIEKAKQEEIFKGLVIVSSSEERTQGILMKIAGDISSPKDECKALEITCKLLKLLSQP
ncbi:MAG: hypothetical protein ABSE68_00650 [Minisyncoccia bacterium]